MTTLIDLSPTRQGGSKPRINSELVYAFEEACEYLDQIGSRAFTLPELSRASGYGAAGQLIRFYLALGFIERISEAGARPVFYRVADHALPVAASKGPGGPTHPMGPAGPGPKQPSPPPPPPPPPPKRP
jgi:hypothetical protein